MNLANHCQSAYQRYDSSLRTWSLETIEKKGSRAPEDSTSSQLYLHNSEEFLHTLKSSSYSSSRGFILISLSLSDKLHKEHFHSFSISCLPSQVLLTSLTTPPQNLPIFPAITFKSSTVRWDTVRMNAPVHKQNTTSLPTKAWTIQTSLNQESRDHYTSHQNVQGGGYRVDRNKNTFLSKLYLYVKKTHLVGY